MPLTPEDVQNKRFTPYAPQVGLRRGRGRQLSRRGRGRDAPPGCRELLAAFCRGCGCRRAGSGSCPGRGAGGPGTRRGPERDRACVPWRWPSARPRRPSRRRRQRPSRWSPPRGRMPRRSSATPRAEHAAKIAEFERQRAAIEAQLGDLRGFERDHLTRVRAYLESQLSELEVLEGAASPLLNTSRPHRPRPGRPPSRGPARRRRRRPSTVSAPPRPAVSAPTTTAPPVARRAGWTHGGVPDTAQRGSRSRRAVRSAPRHRPASPQDSPELFTPPGGAVPAVAGSPTLPPRVGSDTAVAADVDADSDVPSGPPSQADDGETDESARLTH